MQLPDEVASYVRELIMSGKVRPGEFLRMEPIAEAVGVSNTPVREGLLALSNEGFVQLVPRRGFVVAPISRQDVRDLFWAQAQFAGELAARAARKLTPKQLQRIEAIDEQYSRAAATGDINGIATMGYQFHREINLAAEAPQLSRLFRSLVKHLPNRFYATIESHVAATSTDHPELLDALRDRNVRRARSIAERHVLSGGEGAVRMLEDRGFWPDLEATS